MLTTDNSGEAMLRAILHALVWSPLAIGCASVEVPTYTDRFAAGILLEEQPPPAAALLRPVSSQGLELTKASEGWVNRLYNDAVGYCTIGYGHLVKKSRCDGSEPMIFRPTIDEAYGTQLLGTDMGRSQSAVMTYVRTPMTDGQYAALCDFVYNVGATNFSSSTLLRLVNDNRLDGVAAQFRRWVYASGKELPGLKARREREITLFFEGLAVPSPAFPDRADLTPRDIRGPGELPR